MADEAESGVLRRPSKSYIEATTGTPGDQHTHRAAWQGSDPAVDPVTDPSHHEPPRPTPNVEDVDLIGRVNSTTSSLHREPSVTAVPLPKSSFASSLPPISSSSDTGRSPGRSQVLWTQRRDKASQPPHEADRHAKVVTIMVRPRSPSTHVVYSGACLCRVLVFGMRQRGWRVGCEAQLHGAAASPVRCTPTIHGARPLSPRKSLSCFGAEFMLLTSSCPTFALPFLFFPRRHERASPRSRTTGIRSGSSTLWSKFSGEGRTMKRWTVEHSTALLLWRWPVRWCGRCQQSTRLSPP